MQATNINKNIIPGIVVLRCRVWGLFGEFFFLEKRDDDRASIRVLTDSHFNHNREHAFYLCQSEKMMV